jgi:hypothetical protein
MRTVFGAVALTVGGFLLLFTILGTLHVVGGPLGVSLASGCLAVLLAIASFVLLFGKNDGPARRSVILLPSFASGLAGFLLAIGSKNHDLGKYCGIESAGNQTYQLTVRVFGTVLDEESGPAVERLEAGNTVIGPSVNLVTKMVCWELGLDVAAIAAGSFLGGLLGLGICHLTRALQRTQEGKEALQNDQG